MSSERKFRFYLLPNILTTLGLLSGFYAIIAAVNGQYRNSAIAIVAAALFDGVDGRLARLTGTTSAFGKEYDSLADLVSFGMAPALLLYELALRSYGRYGWLAAFLYVATTALRLARFNCQKGPAGGRFFVGLPCPAAACTVATAVIFAKYFENYRQEEELLFMVMAYLLSYLMVSTFPYPSFKKVETSGTRRFHTMVAMVLLVVVLAAEPQVSLFVVWLGYLFSGPVLYGLKKAGIGQASRSVAASKSPDRR